MLVSFVDCLCKQAFFKNVSLENYVNVLLNLLRITKSLRFTAA